MRCIRDCLSTLASGAGGCGGRGEAVAGDSADGGPTDLMRRHGNNREDDDSRQLALPITAGSGSGSSSVGGRGAAVAVAPPGFALVSLERLARLERIAARDEELRSCSICLEAYSMTSSSMASSASLSSAALSQSSFSAQQQQQQV